MKANGRRRKHRIPYFSDEQQTMSSMEDKLNLARDFFRGLMGTPAPVYSSLLLDQLEINSLPSDLACGLEAMLQKMRLNR